MSNTLVKLTKVGMSTLMSGVSNNTDISNISKSHTNYNNKNNIKNTMSVIENISTIAQAYYSYKWYAQATSELQEKLPSLVDCDSIESAQQKYTVWLQYYAFVNAEKKGRVLFRDNYVPIEKRDEGHEHQIKRCEIGIAMAFENLTKIASHIVTTKTLLEQKERQLQQLIESEENENENENNRWKSKTGKSKSPKSNKKKTKQLATSKSRNKNKNNVHVGKKVAGSQVDPTQALFDVELDIEETIREIQAQANATEIQACIDVAELILSFCPEFCARDEMIPGSVDYVAMMEILLLNQSCCKSRYGNAVWNKKTFLRNYDPITLATSIYHVDAQFRLLKSIKDYPDMKLLMPVIDGFVDYMVKKTTDFGQIKMKSPTEQGVTSSKEFNTFYKSTMQEVLTLITYTFYYERSTSHYTSSSTSQKQKQKQKQKQIQKQENKFPISSSNTSNTSNTSENEYENEGFDVYDNESENFEEEDDFDESEAIEEIEDETEDEETDKEHIEEMIEYIIGISIYQTTTECIAHRGNKIAQLKNEQGALNVIWILILCIQNADALLQLPFLIQQYNSRNVDSPKPKKRTCRSCRCKKFHDNEDIDPADKIEFFDIWETKYNRQEDFTKSSMRKIIRGLDTYDLHLLYSIMKKPRSRCCVGHLTRTLNTLRAEYTGEEE